MSEILTVEKTFELQGAHGFNLLTTLCMDRSVQPDGDRLRSASGLGDFVFKTDLGFRELVTSQWGDEVEQIKAEAITKHKLSDQTRSDVVLQELDLRPKILQAKSEVHIWHPILLASLHNIDPKLSELDEDQENVFFIEYPGLPKKKGHLILSLRFLRNDPRPCWMFLCSEMNRNRLFAAGSKVFSC